MKEDHMVEKKESVENERYRQLNRFWYTVLVIFSSMAIFFAINQIFNLHLFKLAIIENSYLYLLLMFYQSLVFIIFPPAKAASKDRLPWYDVLLFLLSLSTFGYLTWQGDRIFQSGLGSTSAWGPTIASFIAAGLVLEGIRRSNGYVLLTICFFFLLFPLFSSHLPGFLAGYQFPFLNNFRTHVLGMDSMLGIPMQVIGTLLIGFMIFGVAMVKTGGGKFFLNFAFSLLGTVRGGPAKVAIVSSGLFGSISGAVIPNILTTGAMTIPAMKRTGYPAYYAAAVEAVSSAGGCLMPPVMGATAFIMASFLGVPYGKVALAALIPSLLYYIAIFVQIDARAVKLELKGIPKNEKPSLKQTFKEGWMYLFAFGILIYLLFYLKHEVMAPFYATALLLGAAMFRKETRLNQKRFFDFLAGAGKIMAELACLMAGIGFVVGSLTATGVAFAFSREIILYAHGNIPVLLLFAAFTSFIMGMGTTISATYIILAVVVAPALVHTGMNVFSVHLFILYWGLASFITPPVATAAYTAATMAGAEGFKTGICAMKLGFVKYLIPFVFVYNPALVFQDSILRVIFAFITSLAGIILLGGSFEGYVVFFGRVDKLKRVVIALMGLFLFISSTLIFKFFS
ncbi:TRAP transporter permease [Thermodesulfobacteriota bacterium]